MAFIEWCNSNMGFASLLLSALTLLVSILAIIVSIRTARLPYKKKLLVVFGSYVASDGGGWHITATNVGNRNIKIKTIGFLLGNQIYINKNTLFDSQLMLAQGETTSQYFNIDDMRAVIKENNISPTSSVYAFVEDTEGKRFKKRLSIANTLFR